MNNNFCLLPWIGIHAWPDGSVFPCCMYDSHTPLGNLNKENIVTLVNNEEYKQLRTQLLDNEQPVGCQRCYQLESSGIRTLRQTTNDRFKKLIDPIKQERKNTISDIKYLDVRFSNICNFKCRTCGPELSHKWGAEMPILKNQPDPGVIQIPKEQFWDFYEQALETAEEIVFAGGEALMQEEHYAALKKLIELKKFNVRIFYTTNMSTLKYKQIDLFELWKNFTNIEIYASLDASGKRAEYMRKGTEWDRIVENVKKLKELPGVKFNLTPTISLFNVWHFPDFHKEWIEEGLVDPKNIRINILTHPFRQQANVLHNKEVIIEKWNEYIKYLKDTVQWRWIEDQDYYLAQFQSVVEFLKTEPENKEELIGNFGWVNGAVDELRQEDLYSVFPELIDHIKLPSIKSKTFCVFPFFNLNSNTDGSVKLCCNIRDNSHVRDEHGKEYNLGRDNIVKIWDSQHLNEVRRKMLFGDEVAECKDCYKHEKLSGSSSRTESNKFWLTQQHVVDKIKNFKFGKPMLPLSSLELRLGNTCNLTCNSCWGYSSSKCNEERIQLLKKEDLNPVFKSNWDVELSIPKDINHWFKTEVYQQNIHRVSSKLNRIYITGGEPTLIKENRRLLQSMLAQGNRDCFVSFTTNGTVADAELLDLLKQFPNNEIQISLDGFGEQGHYVRYPTNWNDFDNNVKAIASIDNVKIVFYTVISAYNLFSLDKILSYINDLAKTRPVGWYPIFLDNPVYMHTYIWPLDTRKQARQRLETHVQTLTVIKQYVSNDVFQKIYDYYIANVDYSDQIPTFVDFNQTLDNYRGTNFAKTFPELLCLI